MAYGATSSAPTVLVTSSTSFLGAHTVLELVRRGYLVKAGVPSVALARQFLKQHPACAPALEWTILPSLTSPRAVEEAVRDVDYVIHVCAPFAMEYEDPMDVLLPAVEGTHALLAAAARQPRVKHVVLTSSLGAVLDPSRGLAPGITYTPSSWNPATWESALAASDSVELHLASKTLTERSAWDFLSTFNPSFALTTFCPPVILGPPAQPLADLSPQSLGESVGQAWQILSGAYDPLPPTRFPLFVDVRDLARMEVAALGRPETMGRRFLAVGGEFSNSQITALVRLQYPSEPRLPRTPPTKPGRHSRVDVINTEAVFGTEWTSLAQSVRDMAEVLFSRERELRKEEKGRVWWSRTTGGRTSPDDTDRLEITHVEGMMTVEVA
ncbi:NADP-binding protein [Dacryopinax primogenitus]|uniref:NADP-binding protein n=1 Tax=Dacryopinax primogenitus (strain DJM 731) TaxID=1858805 RepID=M5GCA1_DACPD|nr:NADP-binding protein [Dacryopinax primogenitus]EJU06125.1 NADP-binding protein [Dacryopinax primogenitus]